MKKSFIYNLGACIQRVKCYFIKINVSASFADLILFSLKDDVWELS